MKTTIGDLKSLIKEAMRDYPDRCPNCRASEEDGFSGDHCDVCGWDPNDDREPSDEDLDRHNAEVASRAPTSVPGPDASVEEVSQFLHDFTEWSGDMMGGWGNNPTLMRANNMVADWIDQVLPSGLHKRLGRKARREFNELAYTTRLARGDRNIKPTTHD